MSELNFEELTNAAAEVVASNPVTDTGDISNTVTEVVENVEWEVDKKSLGIGFGLGAATVGAIVFVPKLINSGRKLFSELFNKDKGDSRVADGDVDDDKEDNEEVIVVEEDEKDTEEK